MYAVSLTAAFRSHNHKNRTIKLPTSVAATIATELWGIVHRAILSERCMYKVTRGISDHGVFPVTQMKAVLCYESLSFRAQLQCCASSDNT